jgi:hypothetical protein
MVINEGRNDNFDIVLRIPDLKEVLNQRKPVGLFSILGMPAEASGELAELQDEVATVLYAEREVFAQDDIRLGVGKTEFTVIQADGKEVIWDLTPLDDEGRIGLKSRAKTA